MRGFFIQLEDNGHISVDSSAVAEAIDGRNWFRPEDKLEIVEYHFNDITKENIQDLVPVGSVQFVNKVLSFYGKGPMKPINIPECLRSEKFLARKIAYAKNEEEIKSIMKEWGVDKVFVKSNTTVKRWTPEIYTGKDVLFEDTEYLVSERVNFVSEWRCFVYRGQLKGIKHYLDDEWIMPNKDFVNECISSIGNSLIAYTLDIGVTEDGKSAVIEAHNFLSCGLYGFESQAVIPMLTNAFKHELNTQPD